MSIAEPLPLQKDSSQDEFLLTTTNLIDLKSLAERAGPELPDNHSSICAARDGDVVWVMTKPFDREDGTALLRFNGGEGWKVSVVFTLWCK